MSLTVLYICPDPTMGGSTQSLLNLIESVGDKVKPIVLFVRKDSAYDAFHNRGIECIVSPFVRLHFFKQENSWLQLLLHPRRLRISRLFRTDRACVKQVKAYLKDRKVDIVHSNYSSILIGNGLSAALGARHIWHIRELPDPGVHITRPYGGYTLLTAVINMADARIVISHQAQDSWGFKEKNTWIIPDAVAGASESCYDPEKQPYILFCSYHLTKAKGALTAVHAFGKSGLFREGIRLVYVGNCTDVMRSEIQAVANSFSCEDSVVFTPCQSDVKPFFVHARAFLMASVSEGLGRVTAEAMFYGCPVVARDSGGTKDLIKDRVTGYLFRSDDECASLLQEVCHTPQEEVIRQAQEFVVSNLSKEVYGPRVLEVYDAVLK